MFCVQIWWVMVYSWKIKGKLEYALTFASKLGE